MSIATIENTVTEKTDLLDRQGFIDQMLLVAETLSKNKKNACYALNGSWGVGKSFVLDMFEEQVKQVGQEGTTLSRYLIFRYNCWEYDYYEEPLTAIVASMLDQIEENVNLLSEEKRNWLMGVLKVVSKGIFNRAIQVVEDKTGIPVTKVVDAVKEGKSIADAEMKEKNSFDQYLTFKDTLNELQDTIRLLAKEQTVVFIVDELDRCLPEYTIRVLERLHHLFNSVPNTQVILSVDREQLQHAVKQIYGEKASAEKYLAKFIGFELKLDEGILNDFRSVLSAYHNCFSLLYHQTKIHDVDRFVTMILEGVDMRERIAILEKCELIHDFLSDGENMDLSVMCMEVFLVLLHNCKINLRWAKEGFNIRELFTEKRYHGTGTSPDEKNIVAEFEIVPLGLKKLSSWYATNITQSGSSLYIKQNSGDQLAYTSASDLWGIILCGYRFLLGFEDDYWLPSVKYEDEFKNHIRKFWDLLRIIH